jgi:hypothetical protein
MSATSLETLSKQPWKEVDGDEKPVALFGGERFTRVLADVPLEGQGGIAPVYGEEVGGQGSLGKLCDLIAAEEETSGEGAS